MKDMIDKIYHTIIFLAVSVAAVPFNLPNPHQPSLQPREDGTADLDAYLRELHLISTQRSKVKRNHHGPGNVSEPNLPNPSDPSLPLQVSLDKAEKTDLQRRKDKEPVQPVELETAPSNRNNFDLDFVGKIDFDTKGERLYARFDSARIETNVPSRRCGENDGCQGENKYLEGGQLQPGSLTGDYGAGAVFRGDLYKDRVTVGSVTAQNAYIFSVTHAENYATYEGNSLAYLGFGFHSDGREPSWFETAYDEGHFSEENGRTPVLSFFHGREASGTFDRSRVTVGGQDASLRTEIPQYIPLIPDRAELWEVAVGGTTVTAAGQEIDRNTNRAARATVSFNTAQGMTIMPRAVADRVFANIPGAFPAYANTYVRDAPVRRDAPIAAREEAGEPAAPVRPNQVVDPHALVSYFYPCDTTSVISLLLGPNNEQYSHDPRDLNLGTLEQRDAFVDIPGRNDLEAAQSDPSNYCLTSIVGSPDTDDPKYMVGTSFMKSWYTIFDIEQPSIGLAKAIDDVADSVTLGSSSVVAGSSQSLPESQSSQGTVATF